MCIVCLATPTRIGGQQLKTAAVYLRDRRVTDCWMAYTASGVAEERYYGVPCRAASDDGQSMVDSSADERSRADRWAGVDQR